MASAGSDVSDLALLAVVALAYANAIDQPFVYDDSQLVLKNPNIRSLSSIPKLVGFQDEGFIYQNLGDDQRAVDAYEAAIASDPQFAEGYNNLGRMYAEQGHLEIAIEMYEKALELNPAYATALQNLAVIYRHGLEDEETALQYEEQARKLRRLQ
jgi:tetratricopeptide (TPR) repeat protein